jgi:hypothetical protein
MLNVPGESRPTEAVPAGPQAPKWARLRYVRCDACGAKALVAASQCPQCGHAFWLRDSRGVPVPLAHCPSCDIYYPRRLGQCRWCGTRAPTTQEQIVPYARFGGGVAAFLVLGWGAWQLIGRRVEPPPAEIVGTPVPESTRVIPAIRVDSGVSPHITSLASRSVTLPPAMAPDTVTSVVSAGSTESDAVAESDAAPMVATDASPSVSSPPPAPPRVAARVAPRPASPRAGTAPARPRPATRWVNTTVRRWVTVRAAATPGARVVATIGPDTRVQLGESRGSWQRLRTRGISGWVDRRRLLGLASTKR